MSDPPEPLASALRRLLDALLRAQHDKQPDTERQQGREQADGNDGHGQATPTVDAEKPVRWAGGL